MSLLYHYSFWLAAFCITAAAPMLHDDDFPKIYNSDIDEDATPMQAEEAATGMTVPEGFRVSLFASEPDVQNPIAMTWDDRGRMWIAENYTYAERSQRFDLSLRDRVLIFEDHDNDGQADSRKVFTDNIQMLTSVEVGRGGVWLMCPPRLLFIPDADEDDRPDGPALVMLDGFHVAESNYHNFANGLKWGPDGWLYGRCGHSCPGRLGVPGTPDETRVPIDGGIWRFHPERKVVEVLCHGTVNPWGHDWDQNGELFFINTVIGHVWHMMPGAHFKESFGESMNPAVYERLDTIADHYHFDTKGRWSDGRDGKANDFGGGHAHIGMMIYQTNHWPVQYHNKLFTLNMHGRRANVERLERHGTGYVARHEPDFMLSPDPFFRGIEISTGPDGNVFVIDWSDTGECHEHTGVHRNSGRIFKISYGENRPPGSVVKPTCMYGNGRLVELWKDYQSGRTTPEMLLGLLRDKDEHVRVWAIRLLTDFWPLDTIVGPLPNAEYPDDDATRTELLRMAREDKSGLVHLTLASTLQRLPVKHRPALARELIRHEQFASDRDLPSMVWFGLIPVGQSNPEKLASLVADCSWPTTARWISRNVASRSDSHPTAIEALLKTAIAGDAATQEAVLLGVRDAMEGLQRVNEPVGWKAFSTGAVANRHPDIIRELNVVFGDGLAMDEIRRIALDDKAAIMTRSRALQTLIEAKPDGLRQTCEQLLDVRSLNAVAVRGLATFDDPMIARLLIEKYGRFHPNDRGTVLDLLVARPTFAKVLLDHLGLERTIIDVDQITPVHARQIHNLGNELLIKQLSEVWGELRNTSAEHQQQIDDLRQQLQPNIIANADLSAGRFQFQKKCALCHTLYGEGKRIGPDLTGAQRSNLDYLLHNIVEPSAVVGKDYRMTVVVMKDGRILSGLVMSKNDKTWTLQTHNEQLTINVADIEESQLTRISQMPDGLLEYMTPQEIRNLFAYLMHPVQVPLPKAH